MSNSLSVARSSKQNATDVSKAKAHVELMTGLLRMYLLIVRDGDMDALRTYSLEKPYISKALAGIPELIQAFNDTEQMIIESMREQWVTLWKPVAFACTQLMNDIKKAGLQPDPLHRHNVKLDTSVFFRSLLHD